MDQQEQDRLRCDWLRLLRTFAVPDADAGRGFDELAAAYGEPTRFYHNLEHVSAVLTTVAGLHGLAHDLAAVQLAVWFHDAVYDSRASDNEERSAALAETRCTHWGIPRPTVDTTLRLILATKTHRVEDIDTDGAILLDADLAILGADESQYERYTRAIRREYAWVAEEDYRRGRTGVLQGFLGRERIYRLDRMHAPYDAAARNNLRRELVLLAAGQDAL